ncbi:hypothetical protein Aperf_G00000019129 [Anoplocephala perfoliata]
MVEMDKQLLLKDLKPNMKFINVCVIVIEVATIVQTKDGSMVRTVKVADASGCMNMSVWNLIARLISVGDILRISRANTTVRSGCLTLNVGRHGELTKTGEFCMLFSDAVDFIMKLFKKSKPSKKQKLPSSPKNLAELIDRLTACSGNSLNAELLSDLTDRMKESDFDREDALRLLFQQIQRPHAQIRLSVVRIIKYLSSQTTFPSSVREAVLLQLQDIFPFCVPTTNSDKPLPPPESAAHNLQVEMLELLLFWEKSDISLKNLSHPARGQLASLLRYLRSSLKSGDCAVRLKSVGHILEELEQKEAQRRRNSLTADAVIRRKVTAASAAYREHREVISENLNALEGVVKLLGPDIFEMETGAPSTSFSPDDFREHGIYECGEVSITFSMDLANADGGLLLPEVKVKLDDDTRLLRATGNEFLNLAQDRHRPILAEFLELARLFETNPELASFLTTDKSDVESLLRRLDRAVSQFSAIHFVEEDANKTDVVESGEDDDDDFVEVPPLTSDDNFPSISAALHSPHPTNKALGEGGVRLLSRPLVKLTNKLPWEMEEHPSSLFSKRFKPSATACYRSGHTTPSAISHRNVSRQDQTSQERIILPPEDLRTRIRKASGSPQTFRKPNDTSEFEVPQLDYSGPITSSSASKSQATPIPFIDARTSQEGGKESSALVISRTKSTSGKSKRFSAEGILKREEASKRCRHYLNPVNVSQVPKCDSEVLERRLLRLRRKNK